MSTDAPMRQTFQWSDLARRSGAVGEALDEFGEVTVSRHGRQLRLAPEASSPVVEAMKELCGVLAKLAEHDDASLVRSVLTSAWPWTRVLPADDQIVLVREIGCTAEVCESLGSWRLLTDALADWRRTARAWADGAEPVQISEPLTDVAARPA